MRALYQKIKNGGNYYNNRGLRVSWRRRECEDLLMTIPDGVKGFIPSMVSGVFKIAGWDDLSNWFYGEYHDAI